MPTEHSGTLMRLQAMGGLGRDVMWAGISAARSMRHDDRTEARLRLAPDDGVPDLVDPTDERSSIVIELEQARSQAMFGFARRLGISDDDAADVVQEALLRLYRALATESIADVAAWTFKTVYRLAMDQHRRQSRERRHDTATSGEAASRTGAADPASVVERRLVWAEVDRLSDRQRAVLYLRYRADLPFEAVAISLGITSSAARSHCTQALAILRSRLAGEAT